MTEDDRQPCGPVGLGSGLHSNSTRAGNTECVGHAGLGGPGWLEGSGRGPGVPGGPVAGDPGSALRPSGFELLLPPLSPPLQAGVQFRARSCFFFPSPYRALSVSPSPGLPCLVSRFRDPTSLLACLHCGLNQSRSGPEAPHVPCLPVFSLIPAFPSSSRPHPFIGFLCPPLSPSEPAREPAQPCPVYTSGPVC